MKFYLLHFLLASFYFLNSSVAVAQRKAEFISTTWQTQPIEVDGDLKDWSATGAFYNDQAKLHVSIANDEENLYLLIRSTAKDNTAKILNRGLSLAVNTDNKKRNIPTITYPILDKTPGKNGSFVKPADDKKEYQSNLLSRIKEIRVQNFDDLVDGGISLNNMYGVKASAAFDENDHLIQEYAIPLKLLNLTTEDSNQIVYQITINEHPGSGTVSRRMEDPRAYRRGMYGGNPYPVTTSQSKANSAVQFYVKSRLAEKRN